MALVGIDLGTTNSLVSIWRDGKAEIINNSLGQSMTPSVVGVDDDGSILVGEIAKQRRVTHPDMTVAEFKRDMGTDRKYLLGKKKYLPEELSALLLSKLADDAASVLGETVNEAVISVPAYFDDNQREATKRAARMAGIEVRRLVNEPSAAILYHQWKNGNTGREGIYVVIDFGGGTLDVSVVDCFENIIEIIAVSGNNKLGGKDFDKAIALDFCKKCGLEWDELKKSVQENIIWAAERTKRKLSVEETALMRIMLNETAYEATYDTEALLKATAEVLVQIKEVLNEALRGAKLEYQGIEDVVLVGGSCKMPAVQKYLSALFGREVVAAAECDDYVALGIGVLTGIIGREEEIGDIVMTDVCPFSLGTSIVHESGGASYMSVIIPKNSILPIAKTQIYSGMKPFQKKMTFDILQGEELYAYSNLCIGNVELEVTPSEQGHTDAALTFCYDINGVLQVTARDMRGENKAEAIIVNKNSKLTEAEIESRRIDIKNTQRFEKNKEENRNLLAWAERLYAQGDAGQKLYISRLIDGFAKSVRENDIAGVQRQKSDVAKSLLQLELQINKDYFGDDDVIEKLIENEQEDKCE